MSIHGNSVPVIEPGTTQEGGIDQFRSLGVQFGQENVGAANQVGPVVTLSFAVQALEGSGGGEKGGVGNTRHIGVPLPVNSDGKTSDPVGRVGQHGIDHQRPARIVAAQSKSHLRIAAKLVLHSDFLTNPTLFLKRYGAHQTETSRENEVSLFIQR